jgi:hypothetical protein
MALAAGLTGYYRQIQNLENGKEYRDDQRKEAFARQVDHLSET